VTKLLEENNMAALISNNNLKLFQLINSLNTSNNTYNFTENELQVLQNQLSFLKRNATAFAETHRNFKDCAGRFTHFARIYAAYYHPYFAIFCMCVWNHCQHLEYCCFNKERHGVCSRKSHFNSAGCG
jgi:hypothetical protein